MEYSLKFLALALAAFYITTKLFTSLYRSYRNRRFAKAHGCLPPPNAPSPLFGFLTWYRLMQSAKEHKHVDYILTRYDSGTTWQGRLAGARAIGTIEPENIKAILATSFKDFELGPRRHASFFPLLGDGIFTLDGEEWGHSRALMRPQFSREQVGDLESLEVHVQRLIDCIEKSGDIVDLQPLFYGLTLDSATEFLLGESVDSLLFTGEPEGLSESFEDIKRNFGDAFNTSQNYIMARFRMRGLCWLINPKKFQESNKICHKFIDHFVDLALNPEKKQKKPESHRQRYVFLDAIAEGNKNPKYLRDQVLHILLAGRDTTASLLGFTFLLLAKYPRVLKKLREEIIDAFGTGKDGNGKKPTFARLKDVTYLRYVLNEGESQSALSYHSFNDVDVLDQSSPNAPCRALEWPCCK